MSLPTLRNSVQTLQMALQAKAKAEPGYRFYSLWDKVYRRDVLWEAYRHCRANDGAPGVDRVTFDRIETQGVEVWLAKLQEELAEFTAAVGRRDAAEVALEFGDILFTLVNVARFSGVHPETALTAAVQKFERRFRRMEAVVADSGRELESVPQSEKDRIWEAIKSQE